MDYHDLLSGFVRVHILHHAAESELYGQWMIEELEHHGYRISPGTLYPMLHAMEKKGYLKSRSERTGRTVRRYYKATAEGRKALDIIRKYLAELHIEAGDNK
jgi:PadR family transcriptional regulator, regulatory protein PadR